MNNSCRSCGRIEGTNAECSECRDMNWELPHPVWVPLWIVIDGEGFEDAIADAGGEAETLEAARENWPAATLIELA